MQNIVPILCDFFKEWLLYLQSIIQNEKNVK